MRLSSRCGFTLVELLVVISVIGILAALTLGTGSFVQNKAAHSRAQGEVAAIDLALERYKIDNADYPEASDIGSPGDLYAADPTSPEYRIAGERLFQALVGRKNFDQAASSSDTTQYIELKKGQTGGENKSYIQDPFKNPYGYFYDPTDTPKSLFNEVVPDFWSTSGKKTAALKGSEEDKAHYLNWVANWPNK